MQHHFEISMPMWFESLSLPAFLPDLESQMHLAVELSRRNVEEETGGPFGAVIVEISTGKLIGCGVNRVVPQKTSIAHAEVMAIALAQRQTTDFDLKTSGSFRLVTSAQMCAMCLGAVIWSGVDEVVFGAAREDVEQYAGFDEGPVHPEWISECERRGIRVRGPFLRPDAVAVLKRYAEKGGLVY